MTMVSSRKATLGSPSLFSAVITSGYSASGRVEHDRRAVGAPRSQRGVGSLRRVALGRKNYLFVGDVEAGASIAGLSCEAGGINPFAYLADVIPRVQDHPKRRPDELL